MIKFTLKRFISSALLIILTSFLPIGCNNNVKTTKENNPFNRSDSSGSSNNNTDIISKKPHKNNLKKSGLIKTLQTSEKIVALTFDACETRTPAYFDEDILKYLIEERLPATLFISGKFAQRNRERLKDISAFNFIEIENHSYLHTQHSETLSKEKFIDDLKANDSLLFNITGVKPVFFRFPGGNYSETLLTAAEELGYGVVHWRIASGDPSKNISASRLKKWVLYNVKPGDILIFHINGRGYKTAKALPEIIKSLKGQGYRFVKLIDGLE